MSVCQAIRSHQQRLDATFSRASQLNSDAELLSDFAKYLCVLVSGFVEKSFSEIALEHAKLSGSKSLQRYIERHTKNFTNANSDKILKFLGSFDPFWQKQMESFLVDEKKAAIDSVYGLRNSIAHGGSTGITYIRITNYYKSVKDVVSFAERMCVT